MATLLVLTDKEYDQLLTLLGETQGNLVIARKSTYQAKMKELGLDPEDEELVDDVAFDWMGLGDPTLCIDWLGPRSAMWKDVEAQAKRTKEAS